MLAINRKVLAFSHITTNEKTTLMIIFAPVHEFWFSYSGGNLTLKHLMHTSKRQLPRYLNRPCSFVNILVWAYSHIITSFFMHVLVMSSHQAGAKSLNCVPVQLFPFTRNPGGH